MQINNETIKRDAGWPTDDIGNSWDTAAEWERLAIDADQEAGEYSKSEWRKRCQHMASEVRYFLSLVEQGEI